MVIEYIRYQVPAAQHDAFIAAYRSAGEELDASEHCAGWEFSQGVEEPDNFMVRIQWDSVEGHEKGFRGSPPFGAFFGKVKPFFGNIREMKHYRLVEVSR
jgi:heme-degrading monooxygenase HmoA